MCEALSVVSYSVISCHVVSCSVIQCHLYTYPYRWSPDMMCPYEAVVQWNGESFKGEGPQNVSIPCDSSQECFYVSLRQNKNAK